jgi:ubiquinone/menaquinone biosynthesis C-methylase UbiE
VIGGWLSGHAPSYTYLAESAAAFPAGAVFVDLIRSCGVFRSVISESLTMGIAYVYVGEVI